MNVELEPLAPPPVLRRLRAGELDIAVVWAVPGEPDLSEEAGFTPEIRASARLGPG